MIRSLLSPDVCACLWCREQKKYKRQVVNNWTGILAYIFFTLAFGFYMWIRITKTLDLGPYLACVT